MFKLLKKESKKLMKAFFHPTFVYLTILGNFIVGAATLSVYFLEKDVNPNMNHIIDTLWWSASTITTVGYGDIVPLTMPGRIIGLLLMFTGTVFFITFTGVLVSIWMKGEVEREIFPLEKEVKKEEKSAIRIEKLLEELLKRIKHLEEKN